MNSRTRLVAACLSLVTLSACSGGINAGVQGGRAFIAFTAMLLVTLGILWLAIGRGD